VPPILSVQYFLPSTVPLIPLSLTALLKTRLTIKFLISLSAHIRHHRSLPGLVYQTHTPPLTNRKHFPLTATPCIITISCSMYDLDLRLPPWCFPHCFKLPPKFFCSNQRDENPGYMGRVSYHLPSCFITESHPTRSSLPSCCCTTRCGMRRHSDMTPLRLTLQLRFSPPSEPPGFERTTRAYFDSPIEDPISSD
jgi:hypothetical protein